LILMSEGGHIQRLSTDVVSGIAHCLDSCGDVFRGDAVEFAMFDTP